MNQFGARLRIQITGESHGPGIGVLLDGVPPGLAVDEGTCTEVRAAGGAGDGDVAEPEPASEQGGHG
ncbi:MAG: chorismate synthase, partial [Thermoplasmatota archaeon]